MRSTGRPRSRTKPRPSSSSERISFRTLPRRGRGKLSGESRSSATPRAPSIASWISASSSAPSSWIQSFCVASSRPYQTPRPRTGTVCIPEEEHTVKILVAALALAAASSVAAQGYPSKPITFIIPFAAGGDSDLSGRNVAAHASKYLNNQPIVSVNRTGASGAIGALAVRNAAPDGYTLLVARIATHAILPALDSKLQYKWNEFTMLSLIELNPYVCFVKGDAAFKTARDLIEEIRRNPGKLNFSTAGTGTSQNMAAQYFMTLGGLTKDHAVGIHYKGGGEVTAAVLGGQVNFACNNAPTVI